MSKNTIIPAVRTLGSAVVAIALFASLSGSPAGAQVYQPGYYNSDHQNVDGVVVYFNRFALQLRIGPEQVISVRLHQGTIINPTGTTLRRGMRVNVRGFEDRYGVIDANRIDFDGWARGEGDDRDRN